MRQDNQVTINDIRARLYERMLYDNKKDYFDILWSGWRQQGLRNGEHSSTFYSTALKRGTLKVKDANSFCNYAVRNWKPYGKKG